MIRLEDLIAECDTYRHDNRRSADQRAFVMHAEARCMRLYRAIISHTVRPDTYSFITYHPRVREVIACEADLRIIDKYLYRRLRPILERHLPPCVHNNRVGMGQTSCVNAVASDIYELSNGHTSDCYVMKLDVAGCFPNMVQDIAYRQMEQLLLAEYDGADRDEMLYMLAVAIYAYPRLHCRRISPIWMWQDVSKGKSVYEKDDGIGASIGRLIWQLIACWYFHEVDEYALSIPSIRYERYVDDMYFVARSKDVLLIVPEIRRIIARVGARLNEHKFYFQHYSKGVECLGTHIKMDRIYINNRPVRQAKQKIAEWNGRASGRNATRFISCINSYLGLCKTYNGYSKAWEIVRTIDGRWFRYIHFDRTRCCLVPNEGYRQRDIIAKRYCINNPVKNEKRRKRRGHPSAHRADDGTAEPHEAQRRTRQQVH